MHSIISFIPIFKAHRALAYVHTPPQLTPPVSEGMIPWTCDCRGPKKRHQAPLTAHFRRAAVIYNHGAKCRLDAVTDLLLLELETGHGAEVEADVEQRLCYVCARLVFLLLFNSKKKTSSFLHAFLCVEEFSSFRKSFVCMLAEGCLAFIFADLFLLYVSMLNC